MKKKTLEQQLYMYQSLSIALTILFSLGVSLYFTMINEYKSLDRSISNVCSLLSSSPEVETVLTHNKVSVELNNYLDNIVSDLEYVDIVTICDTNSIRYYHTNKSMIGGKFSGGDEANILNGSKPYITDGHGTLGRQRRSFYAVKNDSGNIIGFVMVSVLTNNINKIIKNLICIFLILALIFISVGFLFSQRLNSIIKKVLLGFKPEDFRKMYIERTEILDSLEEGIFAINTKGEIILMNESAKSMLDLKEIPPAGTKLVDVYPETQLPKIIETSIPEYNINFIIKDKNILSSRIPIIENGNTIGAVSIFRNKTEVTKMAEELTGAKYMVDTLRAFNHEFMNKLHVILGYIQMGENEKATNFILNTSIVSTKAVGEVSKKIQIPGIAALIIGKIIRASELGIKLILKSDSYCNECENGLPIDIYITILGNLIENAIEELNKNNKNIKEIEVGIYIWDEGAIISVDDTGGGIPDDIKNKIFTRGFSTKGKGRGTGMYLIKDIVDRYNGTLEIDTEENVGTSFTITITNNIKAGEKNV